MALWSVLPVHGALGGPSPWARAVLVQPVDCALVEPLPWTLAGPETFLYIYIYVHIYIYIYE